MENAEQSLNQFDPEIYRGRTIDIVHLETLERIVRGEKPVDDSSLIRDAEEVLGRIKALIDAGMEVRHIENPSIFEHPKGLVGKLILGGALVGECLADYEKSCKDHRVEFEVDGKLSLVID